MKSRMLPHLLETWLSATLMAPLRIALVQLPDASGG